MDFLVRTKTKDVIIEDIQEGFRTAAINSTYRSNLAYRPEFISNDYKQGKKVLSAIETELRACDEFMISVAFITRGGIQALLGVLQELEERGIPGKILTTDYQFFTEPEALRKLNGLRNIELRMYETGGGSEGFHTKGYIFRQEEIYKIIIGSSNMTAAAITVNAEWNTKIISTKEGQMARDVLREFGELWNAEQSKPFPDFYEHYCAEYTRRKLIRAQHDQALKEAQADFGIYTLQPNKMQTAFVQNVTKLMENAQDKALLLSATGTGKTYASAFAARELNPERVLFIVHREQIAKQAKESYRRVFGSSKTYGLISGNSRQMDADLVFSTMQMMSKPEIYQQYRPDDFTMIILDEAHHSGSRSYQRIMSYFTPKLWLGMTASPDTNNYDIYSIFDHNIAYEIRLQQALEEDLLCPFHYYGITDLEIDGETVGDDDLDHFAKLTADARVDHVIEKADYYGYCGERRKGLVFCSSVREAKELAEKFTQRGYQSAYLTGDDSQQTREEVIDRLTNEEAGEDRLEYIFTVDIFNEGIDIPEINQVIMLRPTKSPVIFVQQLGRGLRKSGNKEFVVILDFIGNYSNNFMIPIALSGDRSYNKDSMRRYVQEGSRVIPGVSTIYFDRISKARIYESIDRARTTERSFLVTEYQNLRKKLGRIPKIREFKDFGTIDIRKFIDYSGSYHHFLKRFEPDYTVKLTPEEEEIIEYLSRKVSAYKRIYDPALLRLLIDEEDGYCLYEDYLEENFHCSVSRETMESVEINLTNRFPVVTSQKTYANCVMIRKEADGSYVLTDAMKERLKDEVFRDLVLEILDYGIDEFREKYSHPYKDTNFVLYQKYNYEDVSRLLNWDKNKSGVMWGYFYDKQTQTLPVFINYEKADDAIAYEDRFLSETSLLAYSKHGRGADSADADRIYKRGDAYKNVKIYLFVRKNKDDNEAKEFYFLGEIHAVGAPEEFQMETTGDHAFKIIYALDDPVRSDIYDYITSE